MNRAKTPDTGNHPEAISFWLWAYRAVARRLPRIERTLHGAYYHARHLRPSRFRRSVSWGCEILATIRRRQKEPQLTVGVDVTALWESLTGVGWYLYQLLDHLKDSPHVKIRLYGPSIVQSPDLSSPKVESLPHGLALETVLYEIPNDLALSQGTLIKILRWFEPLLIRFDANSVLFAPNYLLPKNFRLCQGVRVSTVHDLGFRKVPWSLREHTLEDLRCNFAPAVFGAARLISVSSAIRDELQAFGYASPSRVEVIHHGPGQLAQNPKSLRPSDESKDDAGYFVLHVGTIEPRKNVEALIAAWPYLRRVLDPCPVLVLSGRYGWKSEDLQTKIQQGTEEGWIRHLGYVTTDRLAKLYKLASVVVFPSHYEGFGLPAIEAMWSGAPLVCSDLPALREVAGEAALYFEPDRPEILADRLQSVLTDSILRADLIRNGYARLGEFSWESAAKNTLTTWYRADGAPPPWSQEEQPTRLPADD